MHKLLIFIVLFVMTLTPVFSAPHAIRSAQATPVIDGFISQGEWSEQYVVKLNRAYHDQRSIKLYYAHDAQFLYLAADIDDQNLWADGNGGGSGEIFESTHDDSIEWYFDLDKSKDNSLQSNDRLLTLNIGNFTDPISGNGIVSRRSYNAGNGNGGAVGVLDPFTLQGINYKVQHRGTVNNDSDTDQGYSIEVAIPWSLLPNASHADGDSIGINTIIISDDTGNTRDFSDTRDITPPALRFTLPILIDEYVELKHSELHSSQSGLNGPVAYTTLEFQSNNDTTPPAIVTNFITGNPRPFSIKLQWNNPGDNNNQGTASGFDIRYSTQPITRENFSQANIWPFNKQNDLSLFATTTLRVMGLQPSTQYYFAVRAYDEVNNFGSIAFSNPLSTPSIAAFNSAIPANKYQGMAAIAPGGRYFIKENGQPLIPIGTHYLQQDDAIRYLYDGEIFTGNGCNNFTQNPEADEKISTYMAQLKANGITVMRLFLEDTSLFIPNNVLLNKENCAYWFEIPRGNFNTTMTDFLIKILRLSAENGIYVLISPFDTFFYDEFLLRMTWHKNQGGPLTDINDFFKNPEVLAMAKARWTFVINTIKNSGYADAVFGYEILNEWDSFEWTRPDADPNTDAQIRVAFIKELAKHIRSIDNEHLLISSSAAFDPRGALASFIYDSDTFDAVLPHLYLAGNREPWSNPAENIGTSVVKDQTNILSWWTSHQANAKPVLNGEWGPSDGFLPDPSQPSYFSDFSETDDELLIRKVWFSELASGAAGPGIRIQGGVRGTPEFGLHLSDNMFGTAKTISAFVTPPSGNEKNIDFTNFTGNDLQGSISITNTQAALVVTGTTDGKQGLTYIHQDKNKSSATVKNARLNISALSGGAALQAEFWNTGINQVRAQHTISANPANLAKPNDSSFNIPEFNDDWMIKFYEKYSTRLFTSRENNQQIISLKYENMHKAGSVDIYFVYVLNGEFFSLIRNAQGQLSSVLGITPFQTNTIPADGIDEIIRLPVTGNFNVDIYVATFSTGVPVSSFKFKTLQLQRLVF